MMLRLGTFIVQVQLEKAGYFDEKFGLAIVPNLAQYCPPQLQYTLRAENHAYKNHYHEKPLKDFHMLHTCSIDLQYCILVPFLPISCYIVFQNGCMFLVPYLHNIIPLIICAPCVLSHAPCVLSIGPLSTHCCNMQQC